jgi:2-methylisocitrate lyase-like PEP mutase family enzyme
VNTELDTRARRQAAVLRSLHRPGDPLVLANIWDSASARRVVAAGFAAIATSSAAVAESLGREDREEMDPDRAFAAVGRIAEAVTCPVTADIEAGYGLAPEDLVTRLLGAGAAGCNLEDTDHATRSQHDVEAQRTRIGRVRQAADNADFALVINARVDTWLHAGDRPERALQDTIDRGRAYLEAGADCVFAIGWSDHAMITKLVHGIRGPVNIMHAPGDASELAQLAGLGVARISTGPHLWRHVLACIDKDLATLATILSGAQPRALRG